MEVAEGKVYRCSDPECSCELTVTRESNKPSAGMQNPTCCCGKETDLSTS